jgi:3-phosphoshikimate 1-carboxyvinyltransferase
VAADSIEIAAARGPLKARVRTPGSKSITNRALILAAMADGDSTIDAALLSDDTNRMAAALRTLGFAVEIDEAARRITVRGRGGEVPAAAAELQIVGAGTAMRFLAGFLTLAHGRFRIDGNARMRRRPIRPLLDALKLLGVDARDENGDGCPPIMIDRPAAPMIGGEVSIDASQSSQFVSAMLMPAPLWREGLRLRASGDAARPFIEMTLRLMDRWGAQSGVDDGVIVVPGGQRYRAMSFTVEPDATSASYFAAAAALIGGTITIEGIGRDSLQGDAGFFSILERMGAEVAWGADWTRIIGSGRLNGIDVAMNAMPDVVPTLAAIAPFASSPTRIRGVGFIRHHESDRIAAIATELRRLGAMVREFDDGLEIEPSRPGPAAIETYDDHRIAMAFAVAGLKLDGIRIIDPGCVTKTYPEFFRDLKGVVQENGRSEKISAQSRNQSIVKDVDRPD